MDEEYFHGNPADGENFKSSFEHQGGFYGNPEEEEKSCNLLNIGLILLNIPNVILLILLLLVMLLYIIAMLIPFFWIALNPFTSFGLALAKFLWIFVLLCLNGLLFSNENKQYCIVGYLVTIISYLCYFQIFNGNLVCQNLFWH